MEVVANNYLPPGDQRLVDKIVYELKAQGIFDQFRKECFADVDTKPAYQNLRQRVEGSVSGFLKEQSWRPDMNKNQVREMLRKTITELGFLETGVERIVDQVVNPKINTVFLPKVEEVVYNYLGIKKPVKSESAVKTEIDLLPNDLEAVSPESEPADKKDEKSTDNIQDVEESKTEEEESPPFEPLDEQSVYVPQEENSVDSHLSGFSGLISHESNQSNENKVAQNMELDSQISRNSSDSRLSIVTSDDNSKMDICEDSQSKSIKSTDSNQNNDKSRHKSTERHKSRSESKSDRDRKSSKDSKSGHSSSSKNHDRRDSKSSSSKIDKPKEKERKTSSKHTNSKERNPPKKESSSSEKHKSDKNRTSSSNHKDSKSRDKSKEKSSSHKHSSSSQKKDKDKKKSKDDHYSSKEKKNERRSTDRDSNDGQSGKNFPSTSAAANSQSSSSQTQKSSAQEASNGSAAGSNSDHNESTTKAPVIITGSVENSEVTISSAAQKVKLLKPKCASNIQEAMRLMKIRKQLAKLEKQNQLGLATVNVNSSLLLSSSIDLDNLKPKNAAVEKLKQENRIEVVPSPLQNTVISQDNWDTMEAKLRQEVYSEFREYNDDDDDDDDDEIENCKYFEKVIVKDIEFLQFVEGYIKKVESYKKPKLYKRKVEDTDVKNNNKKMKVVPEPPRKKSQRKSKEKFNNSTDFSTHEKFPLPLSPAESDKSVGKKEEAVLVPLKPKRNSISKMNNQRYSSDDLYKPRPTFINSRRRGAKNLEN